MPVSRPPRAGCACELALWPQVSTKSPRRATSSSFASTSCAPAAVPLNNSNYNKLGRTTLTFKKATRFRGSCDLSTSAFGAPRTAATAAARPPGHCQYSGVCSVLRGPAVSRTPIFLNFQKPSPHRMDVVMHVTPQTPATPPPHVKCPQSEAPRVSHATYTLDSVRSSASTARFVAALLSERPRSNDVCVCCVAGLI
jgi:hypothetical protein